MDQNKSTISLRVARDYSKMESAKDLKKNNLTLCAYHALGDVLDKVLNYSRPAETIMQGVANWCRNQGLTVREEGIGWIIAL